MERALGVAPLKSRSLRMPLIKAEGKTKWQQATGQNRRPNAKPTRVSRSGTMSRSSPIPPQYAQGARSQEIEVKGAPWGTSLASWGRDIRSVQQCVWLMLFNALLTAPLSKVYAPVCTWAVLVLVCVCVCMQLARDKQHQQHSATIVLDPQLFSIQNW